MTFDGFGRPRFDLATPVDASVVEAVRLPLVLVTTRAKRELFGDLEVRSVVVPQGDWSPEQALGLLDQGYSVDRVASLTGYDRRWLAAQNRRALDD